MPSILCIIKLHRCQVLLSILKETMLKLARNITTVTRKRLPGGYSRIGVIYCNCSPESLDEGEVQIELQEGMI